MYNHNYIMIFVPKELTLKYPDATQAVLDFSNFESSKINVFYLKTIARIR